MPKDLANACLFAAAPRPRTCHWSKACGRSGKVTKMRPVCNLEIQKGIRKGSLYYTYFTLIRVLSTYPKKHVLYTSLSKGPRASSILGLMLRNAKPLLSNLTVSASARGFRRVAHAGAAPDLLRLLPALGGCFATRIGGGGPLGA